jgi:hypothetical protein
VWPDRSKFEPIKIRLADTLAQPFEVRLHPPVYPMKLGGTLMSSFLFNVNLIMLSSIAVIQFCAQVRV